MARWSDLPAELRFEVLRYVLFNSTVSYQATNSPRSRLPNSQFLSLVLVSRSFVRHDNLIQAMLSATALSIARDLNIRAIDANSKYNVKTLNRLQILELAEPFRVISAVRLQEFKSMLPSLVRFHLSIIRSYYPCHKYEIYPTITISAGFRLDALLKADAKPKMTLGEFVSLVHHGDSTRGSQDDFYSTLEQIDMDEEHCDDNAYQLNSRSVVSKALSDIKNSFYKTDVEPVKWLALLLTDTISKDNEIEVTLSWDLQIWIEDLIPYGDEFEPTFLMGVS